MRSRDSRSAMNDCKKGLSLLICVSSAGLFATQPMANDRTNDSSNEAGEVAHVVPALLARAEPLTNECELAIRRSYEVAPEVLALASWPLDSNLPADCEVTDGASNLAGEINTPEEHDPLSAGPIVQNDIRSNQLNTELPWLAVREPAPNPLGNNLAALADSSLDDIRGGFELADTNLKLSFGIERAVFVNGELVASTVLNVKDLQLAAGGGTPQVTISSSVPGAIGVIQNGSGNGVAAQFTSSQTATVIQNTLNDQKIQNITTINATINSAQMMRAMSVQSAIQQGLVNSLRR